MLEWPAARQLSPQADLYPGVPSCSLFFGELLQLPFIHAGQPILAERGRWADARVIGGMAVTQGMHVRAIQFDPSAYLVSSADGPVTGDEDINVVRHALKQPQPNEVVLNRIRGVQVGERNLDVRKHVACDENAALLDQQRCMALGMPECSIIRT